MVLWPGVSAERWPTRPSRVADDGEGGGCAIGSTPSADTWACAPDAGTAETIPLMSGASSSAADFRRGPTRTDVELHTHNNERRLIRPDSG